MSCAYACRDATSCAVLGVALLVASCTPPQIAGAPITPPTPAEAFGGTNCSAVRPQTEPDFMAWDPASRANLTRLRRQGVVAVRYMAKGCNVELEVMSNCIAPGTYGFSPYSASETKTAHSAAELYTKLPIGASRLAGGLKGAKALRTDYRLVGMASLPPSATVSSQDLVGADCSRATHVVSTIYLGGFAMVAGESRDLDAMVSAFGVDAGARSSASAQRIDREGEPAGCDKAIETMAEHPLCAAPLRIGLMALQSACGAGTAAVPGKGCVDTQATAIEKALFRLRNQNNALRGVLDGLDAILDKHEHPEAEAPFRAETGANRKLLGEFDQELAKLTTEVRNLIELGPEGAGVRVRDLEGRIDELQEQVFRAKARLSLLGETLLAGRRQ